MAGVNVVFMGNVTYPEGMATTKRFQHFIDGVMSEPGNAAHVLVLRQSHPGRDERRLVGEHRGVRYETIGHDMRPGLALLPAVVRYVCGGLGFLIRARRRDMRNVVYHFSEPSVESLPFLVGARLLGYTTIVDIVEDFHLIQADAGLLSKLKHESGKWATSHLSWFADGIIVISSYLQEKMERCVRGMRPVEVVPVSVDLERIKASNAGFHRPVRIVYAGSFGEKDGVENLIDAFDQVAARHPGVELLMSGIGLADRMAMIEERIAASPFANRIHYIGLLLEEEYCDWLSDCDIPCVVRVKSAFAERGFPFKLGEYLATGRPVLASRVSDIEVFLTDRVNAILVEPGSVSAIAAALDFLLGDEPRALAIGRAGRLVAEQHFNALTNGRRLLGMIELASRN